MSDKKLNELIEEYGKLCFRYGGWQEEFRGINGDSKRNNETKEAKQAIIDYVEQEKK